MSQDIADAAFLTVAAAKSAALAARNIALSRSERVLGSQHLGLVLTNAAAAGTYYSLTCRIPFTLNGPITRIKAVLRNGSFDSVHNGNEIAAPFSSIAAAAIEITGMTAALPLTMRAARTWVEDANAGIYETDYLGLSVPAGGTLNFRMHRRVPRPAAPAAPTATAGGMLATSVQRYYKFTCVDNGLESMPSPEVTATPSGSNLSITHSWPALASGDKIRCYGGIAAGAELFMDEIPATATGWVDNGTRVGVPGVTPPANNYTYQYSDYALQVGESCNYNNQAGDLSNAVGALSVNASAAPAFGYTVRPALLVGDDLSTPSAALAGDSIGSHVGIFQNQGLVGNPYHRANWFNKSLIAAGINCVNCGLPSDQVAYLMGGQHGTRARFHAFSFVANVISEYGTNDIYTGNYTWQQVAANDLLFAKVMAIPGRKHWATTKTPRTSSAGGGFLTLADQTPITGGYETTRQNYNTWARNGCQVLNGTPVLTGGTPSPLFAGFFDLAAAIGEVNSAGVPTPNGGYWPVPSAPTSTGTFGSGSTTTVLQTSGLTAFALAGKTIKITSGAAAGQIALIQNNAAGTITTYATGVASETGITVFGALTTAPASGDTFQIWDALTPDGVHPSLAGHAAITAGANGFQAWATANITT